MDDELAKVEQTLHHSPVFRAPDGDGYQDRIGFDGQIGGPFFGGQQ
ncbi:MAG: hypothetical protein M5U34_48295 [Chloroflexi bacterium]|nr:hypothetical protein [Chloroflexota bacterium]